LVGARRRRRFREADAELVVGTPGDAAFARGADTGQQAQHEFVRQRRRDHAADLRAPIRHVGDNAKPRRPAVAELDLAGAIPFDAEILAALAAHLYLAPFFSGQ
jgi:hypothetical protein